MKYTLEYKGKKWGGAYACNVYELMYVLKEIFRESGGELRSVEYACGRYIANGEEVYEVVEVKGDDVLHISQVIGG